ncbi:arginine--tRNA ligase [Lachnospiraceae bacterium NSJ-143]|nr:arginine--tRNA ligase [Lachnospiraceae bacterium NSJ-143]
MDFKMEIATAISACTGMDANEAVNYIEIPPDRKMGDYAFPCFRLAKTLRKAPPVIAQEIIEKLKKPDFISSAEVKGAYVNFFADKSVFVRNVIERSVSASYGSSDMGNGKTVVIDYSSPNIAKPFHVGHLRSTVIGSALYKIYTELGYKCVGINHLGDWGTQFGKLISAYKRWGSKEAVERDGISELMRIYVKFHDEAEKEPSLNDEARGWFVKMQEGDDEAITLWKWFYEMSIREFERVYDILDVKFDSYAGESFYNDKMDAVVEELKAKNLLTESNGAQIVDLEDSNMPPCLIIRSDGGTLYATRDIAAALYRKKTYDFDKCIYITAIDQNLHFAQWFKVIEKMGYDWAGSLVHVPFGLVSLESGKLSTRHGNVVLMEELLKGSIDETRRIIEEKNPDLPDKENVAKQVGIGAVKFNDLYNGRIKDVVFSWSRMLNFDGETGPYVQYTNARACSVLKKAGDVDLSQAEYSAVSDESSFEVCRELNNFPAKVIDAAEKYEPSIISRYLVDLSQAFNKFYHDNPIIVEDKKVMAARLLIVKAVNNVLVKGLSLLGISAPEQM